MTLLVYLLDLRVPEMEHPGLKHRSSGIHRTVVTNVAIVFNRVHGPERDLFTDYRGGVDAQGGRSHQPALTPASNMKP